jgi:hypothetical protein
MLIPNLTFKKKKIPNLTSKKIVNIHFLVVAWSSNLTNSNFLIQELQEE